MDAASFPAPRVLPNARHALGGLWRLTARRFFTPGYWLMLLGMLASLVVLSLPATETLAVAELELLPFVAGYYICFILPILAFISAASAVRDDLGAATIDYVFTRPVKRPIYLGFRYLTQMVCTQIDFLFGFVVVAAIGIHHEVPGFTAALPTVLLGQITAVVVFSAFGCFCGMLTNRYIILGLAYGAVVEMGLGNVPTQLSHISLLRHVVTILRPVVGDADGTLMQAPHINRAATSTMVDFSTPGTLAFLLAITLGFLAAAATLFTRKEFTGSAAKET